MSRQRTDHISRLLRPLDSSTPPTAWPDRPARTRAPDDGSRPAQAAPGELSPPAAPASPGTADDAAQLRETLEQQNELLRAILASSVDAQEDARSTAELPHVRLGRHRDRPAHAHRHGDRDRRRRHGALGSRRVGVGGPRLGRRGRQIHELGDGEVLSRLRAASCCAAAAAGAGRVRWW
jgi:hypothetical protein